MGVIIAVWGLQGNFQQRLLLSFSCSRTVFNLSCAPESDYSSVVKYFCSKDVVLTQAQENQTVREKHQSSELYFFTIIVSLYGSVAPYMR